VWVNVVHLLNEPELGDAIFSHEKMLCEEGSNFYWRLSIYPRGIQGIWVHPVFAGKKRERRLPRHQKR
jgi:hypothetical protein